MPNAPALFSVSDTSEYAEKTEAIIRKNGHRCVVIKCMMFDQHRTLAGTINAAAKLRIKYLKMYPAGKGATTGTDHAGISDIKAKAVELREMERLGMTLLIHGEMPPPEYVLYREPKFLPLLVWINENFPGLRIVWEHITTKEAVAAVKALGPNVTATITAHHLFDTLDVVIGGYLDPHAFCKPVHKSPEDRDALIEAATSGNPKFRFGSDTAPHTLEMKECAHGCAGAFTAPIALQMLASVFAGALPAELVQERLQAFVSDRSIEFYVVPKLGKRVELVREPSKVCTQYIRGRTTVVPYRAGTMLDWSLKLLTA